MRTLLMLTLFLVSSFTYANANSDAYRLATDDIISVTVFNEPDLSLSRAKINDDGTISVPLLGQVAISGKTVSEAEQFLNVLLSADYLVSPRVTVAIDEYRPFYINGEVDRPGSYPFRTGLTVEMAITIAGGFTNRASKSSIFLFREDFGTRKNVSLGDTVKPGDIVSVEESFF